MARITYRVGEAFWRLPYYGAHYTFYALTQLLAELGLSDARLTGHREKQS
ncbi:MAG: hypothetical protein ACTHKH_09100 [Trinickia sp.]|jgi:hypothetical protein